MRLLRPVPKRARARNDTVRETIATAITIAIGITIAIAIENQGVWEVSASDAYDWYNSRME